MLSQLGPAFRLTLLFTIVTGLIYPGVVTGLCQIFFRDQANGSLVSVNGSVVGSRLLGQNFAKPAYLHPRPSAAGTNGYDAAASSGSNLGPTSQKLIDRVKGDVERLHKENPDYNGPIPADAVTASGSGLDPHISPEYAHAQAARIAAARGAKPDQIAALIDEQTEGRQLGFLGDPRVNVVQFNLLLDTKFPKP
jgi:potassium-transporting ATPase KdpC subunit